MARLGTTTVLVTYNIGATLSPYEGTLFAKILQVKTVQTLFIANSVVILLISIINFGVVLTKGKTSKP